MSERERQRRLHVQNRLAELNAKHGPVVDDPLPDWLDHYPETPPASTDISKEPENERHQPEPIAAPDSPAEPPRPAPPRPPYRRPPPVWQT